MTHDPITVMSGIILLLLGGLYLVERIFKRHEAEERDRRLRNELHDFVERHRNDTSIIERARERERLRFHAGYGKKKPLPVFRADDTRKDNTTDDTAMYAHVAMAAVILSEDSSRSDCRTVSDYTPGDYGGSSSSYSDSGSSCSSGGGD